MLVNKFIGSWLLIFTNLINKRLPDSTQLSGPNTYLSTTISCLHREYRINKNYPKVFLLFLGVGIHPQ